MQKCSRHVGSCGHPCVGEYIPAQNVTFNNLFSIREANMAKAMCCDPCKCQICDRRNDGVKSMLRPASNRPVRGLPSSTQNVLLDDTLQVASDPITPRVTPLEPNSTNEQWYTNASRLVQADDIRVLQNRRAQEAQFLVSGRNASSPTTPSSAPSRLSQASPENATRMRNTNLLLDLDEETDCQSPQHGLDMNTFSSAKTGSEVAKEKGKMELNLLD